MSEPTYLVTGAHGFIGAWVVKKLLAQNQPVVIFDKSADPQRLRLIMDADEIARAKFVAGDICDEQVVSGLIQDYGITNIIHLAGVQVPVCRANPRLGALINVVGTINLFEAARQSQGQIQRIAYASSAAVFGESEDGHAAKEDEAGKMATHYGAFKRCNEDNARVFFLDHGLSSVGLRPLTVYGVGRDFGITSGPTKAMKAAVIGRPYHIGFGGKTDFLYVGDTAEAFIRAASTELPGAHVFNLHGETVTLAEVVAEIELLRPAARGTLTFAPQGIPMPSHLDDTAIRNALQLPPATTLAEGVRETIDRFQTLQDAGQLDTSDLDS
jgi:nucleoside-diphosphate-sugar epimerase